MSFVEVIVCDACVVLNLAATGREVDLVQALECRLVMAPLARREARYLLSRDERGRPQKVPANLAPLEAEGLLEVRGLAPVNAAVRVKYAEQSLKDVDGECAALAEVSGLPLATDDAKPRNVVRALRGEQALLSTLELIHEATARLKLPDEETRRLLGDVFEKGGFFPPRPGRRYPLEAWYREHLRALGLLP